MYRSRHREPSLSSTSLFGHVPTSPVYCRAMLVGSPPHRTRLDVVGHDRSRHDAPLEDRDISPLLVGWARLAVGATCLVLGVALVRVSSRPVRSVTHRAKAPARRDLGPLPSYALLGHGHGRVSGLLLPRGDLERHRGHRAPRDLRGAALDRLLAALLLRERLTAMARASLAIAVVGTALLVVGPRGLAQLSGRFGLGALLALGAGVSYAALRGGSPRASCRAWRRSPSRRSPSRWRPPSLRRAPRRASALSSPRSSPSLATAALPRCRSDRGSVRRCSPPVSRRVPATAGGDRQPDRTADRDAARRDGVR